MERRQVEERAYELFQGGLICSESVLAAGWGAAARSCAAPWPAG